LTTLLSTITKPVILLVLTLTFSPCIFNKVINIIKERLEVAHLMLIRTKYESLPRNPEISKALALSHKALKHFNEQN
ncbi:ENVT1 protein, partial [Callaeas wilsoni]|nr:ENVT1 protein [Callaeas wilsoni]